MNESHSRSRSWTLSLAPRLPLREHVIRVHLPERNVVHTLAMLPLLVRIR